jgi:tetratricopeptide (TPR) repeat protein
MSTQRNKHKISVPSFIFALFSLVILCLLRAFPQTQPERIVSIKIAVDRDLNNLNTLRMDVRKLISDSCRDFKRNFGIVHKIEEFVYWTPTTNPTSMKFYLNDLRKKVQKGGSDIVIGIISNNRTSDATAGLASYLQGYIILKNLKSKTAMASVLKHELCHMFGAVDIHEKDSIMNVASLGCEFDEFTRDIILLNKGRAFDQNSYPLSKSCMDEAIKLYDKRVNLNLGEPELHLVLAFFYLEKQELNEALLQYQKALEIKPELMGIQILIGNIHLKMGEPEQALNAYRKASSLFPQLPEVQFNMGLAYTQMGMIEKALLAYDKTIELAPNYFDAHANLGYLYLKKNNPDSAVESSRNALDIKSDSPEALTTLGAALLCQTKHCPPIETEKAYQADSSNGKNASPMDCEQKEKLIDEAIERCRHAISLKSDLPQSHNILGVALAYSGDNTSAEAEFKEACRLRPDYLEAHFNLGVFYLLNHRLEESVDCLSRALAIDPDFALGYQKLTEVYHSLFLEYKKEAEKRGLMWETTMIADFLVSWKRPDH